MDSIITYRVEASRLAADVTRSHQRARRRWPHIDFDVLPLVYSDIEAVVELHELIAVESDEEVRKRCLGRSSVINYDSKLSLSLLHDAKTVGVFLCYPISAETAFIYGVAIKPAFRKKWATPCVKFNGVSRLLAAGYSVIEFNARLSNIDTLNHARRVAAIEIGRWPP